MNLYLISWKDTRRENYDCFESAVVLAESEDAARAINPGAVLEYGLDTWASSEQEVKVTLLGIADPALAFGNGIVCASFISYA